MPVRTTAQRRADLLASLQTEVDAWVTSANANGDAYLIPLSFCWDGTRLIFATLEKSVTARNLRRAGIARVAMPSTRDVVMIGGPVTFTPIDETVDPAVAEEFARRTEWDPRDEPESYVFFFVTPERIQAWRDVPELSGRTVMRNGVWVDAAHDGSAA